MNYNQPNPLPIAFAVVNPTTGVMRTGSWGFDSCTPVLAAQSFTFLLSSSMGGSPLTTSQVEDLHIVPSIKEIAPGYTVTPVAGGFTIDFGAALVRSFSIHVSKLIGEAT